MSQLISPLVRAEQEAIICRLLAARYGISVEEMSERRRAASESVCSKTKKEWVFICYQDCDDNVTKHNEGKALHGFYRVVKKADCYEFTIMECDFRHYDWQKAVRDREVWRFPLDMPMGLEHTAFKNVTPDMIFTA